MKHILHKSMLCLLLLAGICISLNGLEVFNYNGDADYYKLSSLRTEKQVIFTTERFKHDKQLNERWQGINLQDWLRKNEYDGFQSIRFESEDNYMVRIHKAELDSMPGYIVLAKDGKMLDSTEVRVIFPKQRDMFWVRGLSRIYLEDFKAAPPPRQIFVWEAEQAQLQLTNSLEPFEQIKGYFFDQVMSKLMHTDTGSVILVSRDGLKTRLEYPKHLKGSVFELTKDNNLNLISPIIPPGMWLKDVVYLQAGPYALIRQDFLYRLPYLYELLQWSKPDRIDEIVRAVTARKTVSLESLSAPDAEPFIPGDWIELP